ncbi:MAG: carboxypeptidase-like regulatory domain-containing protein [Flavobacteriales bacterium]|nr:carboxypeptidase-like regulatory domain-containing protein [Flavobacteriales bacterium]
MERMLHILSCLLAIVLLNKTADAQQRLLHGRVLDAVDERPIPSAHITVIGQAVATTTDTEGRFSITLGECAPCSLVVSHVSYLTLTHAVAFNGWPEIGPLVLRLEQKVVELGIVDVRRPAPEVVFQRNDLHVGDYLVNDEGLWVLVYEQKRLWHSEQEAGATVYRGGRLYLLDTLFNERSSVRLPGEVCGLLSDHAQRPLVEGRTMGWYAQLQGDGLALQQVDLATLHKAVLPWTDSIQGLLLGNNLNAEYPAFDHIAYDPKRDSALLVCSVVDEFLLELFRSQYKYMSGRDKVIASDIALRTGLDREVVAGFMTGFSHDIYYRVPYAPLFVVHDTLRVFDHYKERIRPFTASLEPLADVPLTHHNERHWKQRLLHDVHDDRIYALFAQGIRCWLREVDVRTGALGPVRMLTHASPEEVQVHAGHAYYVYRVPGSLQTRTLYREALR